MIDWLLVSAGYLIVVALDQTKPSEKVMPPPSKRLVVLAISRRVIQTVEMSMALHIIVGAIRVGLIGLIRWQADRPNSHRSSVKLS